MTKRSKKIFNEIRLRKEREFKRQLQIQKITDLIYIADLPKMLDELFERISKLRLEFPHEITEYNKPNLLNILERNLLDLIEKTPRSIKIIHNGAYMAFNTGLVANDQHSIFMILERNPLFRITVPQQWRFLKFIQVRLKQAKDAKTSSYYHLTTTTTTTTPPKIKIDFSNIKSDQAGDELGLSTDDSYETCPICNGDGGVRGGCYKCSGSGWISAAARTTYSLGNASAEKTVQDTRISNSSNYGLNAGAHYRERDGRIGSYPSYDDYSEEGDA